MPDRSQHDFRTTALDPGLLSTPFGVQTHWHVITGAPSCGKTTLINLLADKGFQTVPEVAREYMEREIARGRTIDEIHENGIALDYSALGYSVVRVPILAPEERLAFVLEMLSEQRLKKQLDGAD